MQIPPTSQRLGDPLLPNLTGLQAQETQASQSVAGDLLQVSSPREAVEGGIELDAAGALAALDFARQSISLNPGTAISVQANARPENVLGLISESVLPG